MADLIAIFTRIDRQLLRFRSALNVAGWLCFGLITADYAGFIELPSLVTGPLWFGVLLNIFRWAIWEGMIKPQVEGLPGDEDAATSSLPDQTKNG